MHQPVIESSIKNKCDCVKYVKVIDNNKLSNNIIKLETLSTILSLFFRVWNLACVIKVCRITYEI